MAKISPTQKIINQAGFIETQMLALVPKLEEHELHGDADELEAILEKYSEFSKRMLKELVACE